MHIANYTAEKMSFCDKVSLFKLDVGRGHNVKFQGWFHICFNKCLLNLCNHLGFKKIITQYGAVLHRVNIN